MDPCPRWRSCSRPIAPPPLRLVGLPVDGRIQVLDEHVELLHASRSPSERPITPCVEIVLADRWIVGPPLTSDVTSTIIRSIVPCLEAPLVPPRFDKRWLKPTVSMNFEPRRRRQPQLLPRSVSLVVGAYLQSGSSTPTLTRM